jgi:hypothetical protein
MNDRPVMVINNEHGWLSMLPELHSHRSKPRNSKSPYRIASDECFGSGGEQDKAGSAAAADVCFGSKADIALECAPGAGQVEVGDLTG